MTLRRAFWPSFVAVWVLACGGTVFHSGDGSGGAGSGATGNEGGSSSTAGTPGKAGSSHSGGKSSTGGSAHAGSSVGGSVSTGGSAPIGGSVSMGGGPNCDAVDCAYPACTDNLEPYVPVGQCCPVCPQACGSVKCTPVMACPSGYELKRPAGACCQGCVPNGAIACPEIACPQTACPLGYVRGDLVGGCCTDCVPDALFCEQDSECVIAQRPQSCCGCPSAISTRTYAEDLCWSRLDAPRQVPQECYPAAICDAVCGPCPPPGTPRCEGHRCLEMGLK